MVLAPRQGLEPSLLTKKKKIKLDQSSLRLIRRLAKDSIRPYAGKIVLSLILMGVVAAATAASAWLMDPVVNKVFVERRMDMLWPVGLAVLTTAVVKGLASYGSSVQMSFVGLRIIADLQDRLFRHMLTQDIAYFHATTTGRLLSRFNTDVNLIRAAVSNALVSVGKDSLSVLFLVAVMFYQDWMLASISFFVFPLTILPIIKLGRRIRRVTANTQEEWGLFTTLIEQCFQGIRVVKAYGMERYESSRVANIVENIFKLNFRASRTRSWSSPIMETLGGAAVTVVIVYGGSRVIEGATTAGAFFSFITALLMAYQPLKALANLNANLQEGLSAAQRVFEVLDTVPSIQEAPDAKPLEIKGGAIRFQNVHFAYNAEKGALHGLSMEVPAGATVALVGPSGAGKSTIQNLIPRFYDVQEGTIAIDGQDVQKVQLASLRSSMALVSQEVVLFDDTIRANIAYGRLGASQDEIEAAARAAAAHDFITALPQGYDTTVGEHGVKLSGGQRQRLAIARAMLRNAPILLLDEATSALDTESERAVQTALDKLMQGRTTLVIAHRLSTITHADKIFVIDQGRVAESGTHAGLLEQNGLYARLHALQAIPHANGSASP
ncbi:MAG: lipid A export permease/ATP-binding protein MsbA [Alphaproteobacteria bacterium]|nr:lipid A export permease/ATP-binding protein MsbA [Alphaproteobacteria bacterium]